MRKKLLASLAVLVPVVVTMGAVYWRTWTGRARPSYQGRTAAQWEREIGEWDICGALMSGRGVNSYL